MKVLHHKQGRFKDRNFLFQTAKRLQIHTFNLPSAVTLQNLKEEKRDYLHLKRSHQSARDRYILKEGNCTTELKKLRERDKMKLKWKMLKNTLANAE